MSAYIHRPGARFTWPVIVSATERTYDTPIAGHRARQAVYRVCALLSLAYGYCFVPRSDPSVLMPGQLAVTVPQTVGDFADVMQDSPLPDDINIYKGDSPLLVPAWPLPRGPSWTMTTS
jgi:hypothetical protein